MLNRIAADAFALTVSPPSFVALTADTLGNAATETDGFDAALQDIALALESESAGISGVDSDLEQAVFTIGAFESDNLAPIAAEIAAAVTAGDPLIDELDALLGP